MLSIPVAFLPLVLLYILYKFITEGLPRFFLVPSQHWQDKIQKVITHEKPIYLLVGSKRLSFRRRLITASSQPSYYTNYVNNKIKIHPTDSANENEFFTSAMKYRGASDNRRRLLWGFFHPYANNGGGGEKVLWHAVHATLLEDDRNIAVIYTTNTDSEPLEILGNAQRKFGISGIDSARVVFVYLRRFGRLIDGDYWKHFTLIGQLVGSALLALEAMYELSPDVWVDTMGLPGSYLPVWAIIKVPVMAYVHYPIIQPDMFRKLKFEKLTDLKKARIGDVPQVAKFVYWSGLYYFYAFLGSLTDAALANGTWTEQHIRNIWVMNLASLIQVLFPPCEIDFNSAAEKKDKLLYVAQFRPEKRHALVVENYNLFLAAYRAAKLPLSGLPKLVLLGSCRTPDDSATLDSLKLQIADLDLSDYIELLVDQPFDVLSTQLAESKFGLNAMWNEHFGIGVVEYASAGCVPVVHASAGPLLDIVRADKPAVGWENEAGFFFRDPSDPDVEQDGDLLLAGDGKFPTLAAVLSRLYISEKEKSSLAYLASKRTIGETIVRERFSSAKFADQWTFYCREIATLEARYREDKRDKVDTVY